MDRFDNDPTPVSEPETIADLTPVTSPVTPQPDLIEPPPVARMNSSVDCSLDELRRRQLNAPSRPGTLDFSAAEAASESSVDPDIDEDDETVVSFPRVGIPHLDPVPVPPPSKPGSSTGPKRALQQELFEDLPEIDADPPPPLMVAPRPKVGRRRLKTDARRKVSRRVDLLMLTIAFLGGVIAASVVFLSLIYLRAQPEPIEAPEKRPASVARERVAVPVPQPLPVPTPPQPGQPDPEPVASRPDPPRPAAESNAEPRAEPRPEPAPPAVESNAGSKPEPPAVKAGKQIARALSDCRLRHNGQSMRLGVWVLGSGRIRKVYPAKRRWIGKAQSRCIRRRLLGMKLDALKKRGYVEWNLWLGRYPDATLLRHIR